MMLPLIGNILVVTISLEWRGTPFVLAFLMLLNLILLWQYRDYFRPLIDETATPNQIKKRSPKTAKGHLVWLSGLALQLFSILVSYYNWPIALGVVVVGIILSVLSFRADKAKIDDYALK